MAIGREAGDIALPAVRPLPLMWPVFPKVYLPTLRICELERVLTGDNAFSGKEDGERASERGVTTFRR